MIIDCDTDHFDIFRVQVRQSEGDRAPVVPGLVFLNIEGRLVPGITIIFKPYIEKFDILTFHCGEMGLTVHLILLHLGNHDSKTGGRSNGDQDQEQGADDN